MKNKSDIRRDRNTNDVVVYDENGKECFRRPYSEQTVGIANAIYMAHKYTERSKP